MNKIVWKDNLREIKNSWPRFLSIFLIILLGVSFFVGIKAAGPSMLDTAKGYFEEYNLADGRILSTWGFDEDDIEALSEVEGVRVEGWKTKDVNLLPDSGTIQLYPHYDDRPNYFKVVEGRLPSDSSEIALDSILLKDEEYKLGDKVKLGVEDNEDEPILTRVEFTVVGFVETPYYFERTNRGQSLDGSTSLNSFGVVREDVLDSNIATEVYWWLLDEVEAFSDEYDNLYQVKENELEEVLENRSKLRYKDVTADIDKEIKDGEKEVEDGYLELKEQEDKLKDARKEYEEGVKEYKEGEKELQEAKEKLASSKKELDDGRIEYDNGLNQLKEAKNTLSDNWVEYEEGVLRYEEGLEEFNSKEAELQEAESSLQAAEAEINAKEAELNEASSKIEENRAGIIASEEELLNNLQGTPYAASDVYQVKELITNTLNELTTQEEALLARIEELSTLEEADSTQEKIELEASINTIQEQRQSLESINAQVSELISGKEQLEASSSSIQAGSGELQNAKEEIESTKVKLQEGRTELEEARVKLTTSKEELDEAYSKLTEAEAEIAKNEQKLKDSYQVLKDGNKEYKKGEREYQKGKADLDSAKAELQDAKEKLTEGEEKFEKEKKKALKDLEEAELDIEDAKAELKKLKEPTSYLYARDRFTGYETVKSNADKLEVISNVFPVFFFLIAIMVTYMTITRMTNEQRNYMGTMKQLGYPDWVILSKFVVYAGTASILGSLLGIWLGYKIFPPVIMYAYNNLHYLDEFKVTTNIPLNITASLIAILCAVIPAVVTPLRMFRTSPANLLRPLAPKAGGKSLLEHIKPLWRRLSFTMKMTIRNITRYKGRSLLTIAGVAGSTMLIVTGFGISDSVNGMVDVQFDELQKYEVVVALDEEADYSNDLKELEKYDGIKNITHVHQESFEAVKSGKTPQTVNVVVPMSGEESFSKVLNLRRRDTKKQISLEDNIIVSEYLPKVFSLGEDDFIDLEDSDRNKYKIKPNMTCENLIDHYIYMSQETFEANFNKKPKINACYITLDDNINKEELLEKINGLTSVVTAYDISNSRETIKESLASLELITIVLIIAAASLAFVVLYNLLNINISERIRELSTIKVLGFYSKEVTRYIADEIIILTAFGVGIGMYLGKLLTSFIMNSMSLDRMYMFPKVDPLSYVKAVVLTYIFVLIIMLVMHRRIRDIDMVEALKAVE